MPENQKKDYLEMSDEDFLQINSPEPAATEGGQEETPAATPSAEELEAAQKAEVEAETAEAIKEAEKAAAAKDDTADAAKDADADGKAADGAAVINANADADPDDDTVQAQPAPAGSDDKAATTKKDEPKDPGKDPNAVAAKLEPGKDGKDPKDPKDKDAATADAAQKPVDYEGFFKQVMTPFKANGREIKLKTPEEAIRLMQMGAGYGRKIQDLQPHLKVLRMLEKNELLDESKLSFLIDINQKNPDAVKKLIKESGIDPLDLNTEDNVDYKPKNHSVSDREMAFHNALSDVQAQATGQETLKIINQTWDQKSKSLLWESPEVLGVIQSQRENGIYDQIATEIDRQKLLGAIPPTTPFLEAYQRVGNSLFGNAANAAKPAEQDQPIQPQPADQPAATPGDSGAADPSQPQVIATRSGQPKQPVQNNDKARAASPTKSAPSKAAAKINPLEMADEDFLKQFEGRL